MEAHRFRDSDLNQPVQVFIDTNFLMIPHEFKVDILGELSRLLDIKYELIVPDQVLVELKTISKKGNLRERKAATVGLHLTRKMKSLDIKGHNSDDAIVESVNLKTIVCTNDKELKRRVLNKGGKVIFLKQKKFLELVGGPIGLS